MDINARFKQVRLELAMGQEEFGSEIGLSKSGISNIESGVRKVTDKHIKLVCAIFNVNETWLRSGAGEMFNRTESDAIDQLCTDMNAGETETALLREVLQYYFKIDPKIRDAFARHALDIAKSTVKPTPQPKPATPKNDPVSEIEELKRQNRELQEQIKRQSEDFAELRKEMAELKQEEADAAYVDKLSSLFFSTPESSDAEKAKQQKTAHQHDH